MAISAVQVEAIIEEGKMDPEYFSSIAEAL
jgi:hypothetical protein